MLMPTVTQTKKSASSALFVHLDHLNVSYQKCSTNRITMHLSMEKINFPIEIVYSDKTLEYCKKITDGESIFT